MGGNVVRLGNLVAGPLVVLALATRPPGRRLLLVLLAIPLLYLQWQGAVRDVSRASADPSVQRDFYTPLLAELNARTGGEPVRIEIPPTRDRWEAYYVSAEFPLARGWERQAETDELHLFRSGLSPRSYRNWLLANGVSYVAIPDVPLDYLAHREELLINRDLPYLEPIWSNGDWRLFAVRDATGLVDRPASISSIGADWFDLRVPHAANFELRIHFSPYWKVDRRGCLSARAGAVDGGRSEPGGERSTSAPTSAPPPCLGATASAPSPRGSAGFRARARAALRAASARGRGTRRRRRRRGCGGRRRG